MNNCRCLMCNKEMVVNTFEDWIRYPKSFVYDPERNKQNKRIFCSKKCIKAYEDSLVFAKYNGNTILKLADGVFVPYLGSPYYCEKVEDLKMILDVHGYKKAFIPSDSL